MVRQPGRHRGGPIAPLEALPWRGGDEEAVMGPAEVVGTAHQVHPPGQDPFATDDRPAAPRQWAQRGAEGRVQPFEVRRVDPRPRAGRRQHRGDRRRRPQDDPPRDVDEAPAAMVLDHLAQEQPGGGHQPRPPRLAGPHRVAKDADEGGHVARQAVDADQECQALCGTPHHLHDRGDQALVAACADHPAQPEPRRDGHRHGHPEPPGDRLDVQLIGLDVPQLDLPAQDVMLMEVLPVPTSPIAPGGDGPLVEAEGGDDRLERTAMAEQGESYGHHLGRLLEAVERGVMGGGESSVTGGAAVAPLLAAVDADVAEPELPPSGAVGVVAELVLRVHRRSLWGTVWRSCPEGCWVGPRFSRGYPLFTVQWGATRSSEYS